MAGPLGRLGWSSRLCASERGRGHPHRPIRAERGHPHARRTRRSRTRGGDRDPDAHLLDGQVIEAAGADLRVLHTPGHAPGAVCLYDPGLGTVFTGDTLFKGGPGATGRSFSHFPTIIDSIRDRLLTLPPETEVLTGHGDPTTIGAEAPHLEEWIARGH